MSAQYIALYHSCVGCQKLSINKSNTLINVMDPNGAKERFTQKLYELWKNHGIEASTYHEWKCPLKAHGLGVRGDYDMQQSRFVITCIPPRGKSTQPVVESGPQKCTGEISPEAVAAMRDWMHEGIQTCGRECTYRAAIYAPEGRFRSVSYTDQDLRYVCDDCRGCSMCAEYQDTCVHCNKCLPLAESHKLHDE